MRACLVSPGSSSAPSVTRIYHFIALVVPASGFSKRNRAYVSRTDTRHSPHSSHSFHSSPRTMTRHRGSESCLALVYTLLLATLVVSSSAALTREATTRTASRSKDPLTTEQHSVATRTPPVLAAQPRVDDLNASIREIHNGTNTNTNTTELEHGNVEQSRWWWWWTWWAAPRVVYIYPGHQQQYPHNPYPPVQPPLVEPNCPQVSLLLQELIVRTRAISMTSSCLFYTQVTTGNGQPVRDCCCPSGCAIR